jgi:hypothetical protein
MATIEQNNYNAKNKSLEIVFGYDVEKVYTYAKVPKTVAEGLDSAESKGKYFHANIRGKFETTWEYRD